MFRKADLYIRVSTDEQADKGYSQRDQEDRLRKYCAIKGYSIRNIFLEDHSAKSFNRPEWSKYLMSLKEFKKNNESTLLLFTKWDRFSRNAADAYQMISKLRTFYVEPEAVEQPLDLTIPENKIMLAFYLAAPEVENDRRALNVFHGMRRAKKEGRAMGTAPFGYDNKITKDKRKYIALNEDSKILKWAFEQIAADNFSIEQIWKLVRERRRKKSGLSKNNFWNTIQNPVYCGKIFIPPFKDEQGYFVTGQHEPLISEKLFNDVQDVIHGRKRIIKPKIVSSENLPLRGFIKCPNCDKMMTGSASRGSKGVYYNYYHCTSDCGTRFKAEIANEAFIEQLHYITPKDEYIDLFVEAFKIDYKNKTKLYKTERTNILEEIESLNRRYQNALLKNVDGQIEDEDFKEVKKITKDKIESLEAELNDLNLVDAEIEKLLTSAIKSIANIDQRYINGDIQEKRLIISSMFPENLEFDGTRHRTLRMNSAVNLIYQTNSKLRRKKRGTNLSFLDLSREVHTMGLEPIHP